MCFSLHSKERSTSTGFKLLVSIESCIENLAWIKGISLPKKEFSFSQEQINHFAELSGDKNPIHIDADYAAKTSFGRTIVHGVFTISVFSQIIGMEFPGEGTIYLGQDLDFKRPVFPDQTYTARLEVMEVIEGKHIASIKTQIFDPNNILNPGKIISKKSTVIKNFEKL